MADCPDTMSWVEKAEEDARAARLLSDSDLRGFRGTIAFHCEQSAEKHLKACLVYKRITFPRTHDLGQLVTLCLEVAAEFDSLRAPADRLQPYAVEARYPYVTPNEEEVKQALEQMAQVRKFCRGFLGITED